MNEHSRNQSPVAASAYLYYARHIDEILDPLHRAAELFINDVLVRNTLSTTVRKELHAGTFPFLRLDLDTIPAKIVNLAECDELVMRADDLRSVF